MSKIIILFFFIFYNLLNANILQDAIDNAKEGDIILLLGKGHETYREIKGVREHLDEREIIKDILNNK